MNSDDLAQVDTFLMLASFLLGANVGSFANVCVCRWPAGESVVSPRSRCPKCMNAIVWYDNIPVLSWLMLGAKCRHCDKTISWQYPLVEALTGVVFLLVYWEFGMTLASLIYMGFAAAMIVVTFQDLADWTIPDQITIPGIFIGIGLSLLGMVMPESGLLVSKPLDAILGAALGGGIIYGMNFITVVLLKKFGMGFGDVKLLAMIGAFTGWQGAGLTLIGAAYLGTMVGVPMILYFKFFAKEETGAADAVADGESEGEGGGESEGVDEGEGAGGSSVQGEDDEEQEISLRGHYLPFGPYLAIAGVLYVFFGPQFIDWYLGLMSAPLETGAGL